MKILLFGKNGQLGSELRRSLAALGEVVALGSDSAEMCGNLRDFNGIARSVRDTAPDVIINAAAYTAVDKAESECEAAEIYNAKAPAILALEAKKIDALLVHYSTDYVFDGSGDRPWRETDAPAPLNVYGATKLGGERAIADSGCRHLTFRTSWVYATRGNNFIKTILRLAQERDSLRIVDDQIGAPTGAEFLAAVTTSILRDAPMASGLYHLAAGGETSWFDYANFILKIAQQAKVKLKVPPDAGTPIHSKEFPVPAIRPHNSRLDMGKVAHDFGIKIPDWRIGVEAALLKILANNNDK